jgi:hypothetical protein
MYLIKFSEMNKLQPPPPPFDIICQQNIHFSVYVQECECVIIDCLTSNEYYVSYILAIIGYISMR